MDDRTDDCAFGAMMSLALRQTFRKLRFQMIADNRSAVRSILSGMRLPERIAESSLVSIFKKRLLWRTMYVQEMDSCLPL